MKLRNLFVIVLVAVTVTLLLAVVSGFQLYGSAVSENERESLQSTADATATQLDALLSERSRTVDLLAADPVLANLTDRPAPIVEGDEPARDTLRRFVRTTEYQGVSVIDADGRMVGIESEGLSEQNRSALLGADFSDRAYFQRALSGQRYVSDPVEAETGNFIITVSVPIERDGAVPGTVNAALHLQRSDFFDSIAPDPDSDLAVRVSGSGETLAERGEWDRTSMLTATAEKTTTGWTVTVARPAAAVDGGAETVTLLQAGAVLLVVGTLIGFALWFYQSSIRQTERVLAGFDRLANREYGAEIDVGGTEEWVRIGNRFNAVSSELARHERELTQYKRAIQEATDLICVIDTDGRYTFANPQYREYHGIDQVAGLTVEDVVDSGEYATVERYIDRALDGAIVTFQSTRSHPTRGERTLDVRYYPLDDGGETTGIVAVLRDVTEREERARQIRVVDRVLRHNLRNDLTVIGLQAERITSRSSGTVEAAADEILAHAEGLLTTSEKSRSITEVLSNEPTVQAIEIGPLVRDAASGVAERYDANVTVEAPEGVSANTTAYFPQAVEEIVENGFVHNDRDDPTVELRITAEEKRVTVRVVDDGPGIPEMDRDVLETGRPIDDLYHGSGLGLWLVYWIVNRSGGSVTVREADPRGTVVEIHLARAGGTSLDS